MTSRFSTSTLCVFRSVFARESKWGSRGLCLLIVIFLSVHPLMARVWTSTDGRKLEAEFVKADATALTVRKVGSDRQIVIPLDKLSEADRLWISEKLQSTPGSPGTSGSVPAGEKGRLTKQGSTLMLDGKPWLGKGVCYHPVPIGSKAGSGDLCADDRAALWERDLPNIRSLGANLIRVYSWDVSLSHKNFLKALRSGPQPIHIIVNKYIKPETDWSDQGQVDALVTLFQGIAKDVAKEEIVMGIGIGNETNISGAGDKDAYWKAHEQIAAAIKKEAPQTLVMIPITDKLAHLEKGEAALKSVDVWAMQIYRGTTFGRLFNDYERLSKKPLLITEYGVDAYDAREAAEGKNGAEFVAKAFESLWQELSSARKTCAGGCWFSYSDEWWKADGSPDKQDVGGKPNSYPDGQGNEEWYGIFRIAPGEPNVLTPRKTADAMKKAWLKE